jgi:hypothetical protein
MSQQELLRRVVEALDSAGVPYMAVGSIVSSFQGEPRATHDIDLVVVITPAAAAQLVAGFPPPDFYLDAHAVESAMQTSGMFNLLDITGGDKVDFWMLRNHPYDRECFARRRAEDVAGLRLYMLRPEDTILTKLRWAEEAGGSEKQFGDALRVYEVQYGKLDVPYMDEWASRLGIEALWMRLKTEADVQ